MARRTSWMDEINRAISFDDFERVMKKLADQLTPKVQAGRARGGPAEKCDAGERIRRFYFDNNKRALEEILKGPPAECPILAEKLQGHFAGVFDREDRAGAQRPPWLPRLPRLRLGAQLERCFSLEEVEEQARRSQRGGRGRRLLSVLTLEELVSVFNRCLSYRRVPSAWKTAETILVFKKGDPEEPGSWRPIWVGSSLYNLFARCVGQRLSKWVKDGGALSPQQKGLLFPQGCEQHVFLLQQVLGDACCSGRECAIAKLDLDSASSCISHSYLSSVLSDAGVPEGLLQLLRELYEGYSTTVRGQDCGTEEISIRTGLRQGCPLNLLFLALALEPLVRYISGDRGDGFDLFGETITVLTYVDDFLLVAKSREALQAMLDRASKAADWMGLRFKAEKCESLHIGTEGQVLRSRFIIQKQSLRPLQKGCSFWFLGVSVCFPPRAQQDTKAFEERIRDIQKIGQSQLSPGQKMDAWHTVLLPRISAILARENVPNTFLDWADGAISAMTVESNQPVLKMRDLADVAVVSRAFRMLTCSDPTVAAVASGSLQRTVQKKQKMKAIPTKKMLADYLNGHFGRDGEFTTLWSHARNASCRLQKRVGCTWDHDDDPGGFVIWVASSKVGKEERLERVLGDAILWS